MAVINRRFDVYIVASISGTLYVGVTNNLLKRIWQHKQGKMEGFTKRYEVTRLIYFESFDDRDQSGKATEGLVAAYHWFAGQQFPSW